MTEKWLRPGVKDLHAYQAEAVGPAIRLDANETPFDVPLDLKQEIWEGFKAQAWNRYPDPTCQKLRQAIADAENVDAESVVAGNGSDELIRDLLLALAGPDSQVVFPEPTFTMYRQLAVIAGAKPVAVPVRRDWSLDAEAVIAALKAPKARMLFLASPNNPTGVHTPWSEVEVILRATDRLVVVDEAYRMFCGETVVGHMARYPHLAILNTVSKAMSLAGLRVGYLLSGRELAGIMNKIRLPYNVDAFAQHAAKIMLQHRALWEENARRVVAERERVFSALQSMPGVEPVPSRANFIFLRANSAEGIKFQLAKQGVAVRGFAGAWAGCLRVTIGQEHENNFFLRAFSQALGR